MNADETHPHSFYNHYPKLFYNQEFVCFSGTTGEKDIHAVVAGDIIAYIERKYTGAASDSALGNQLTKVIK